MTEADYEEHGAAFLRLGYDEGPVYVLYVTRAGTITFEEWADQDYEIPLRPERTMGPVPPERALENRRWLAWGAVDRVRDQPWEDG